MSSTPGWPSATAVTELAAGPQHADDDAAVLRMGAEDGMRIGVLAADERLELAGGDGHAPSKIRPMPATGIEIQSGRLLSS